MHFSQYSGTFHAMKQHESMAEEDKAAGESILGWQPATAPKERNERDRAVARAITLVSLFREWGGASKQENEEVLNHILPRLHSR